VTAETICGVITGDIVGSSELPKDERRELYDIMREAGQLVEEHFADAIALPVDIFAGDTWQVLVIEPAMTLRIAMFYRAIIRSQTHPDGKDRKLDTRLVMAIGPIDFVPAERTSEGEGEAFRLSGRGVKELKRYSRMAFRCPDERREQPWNAVAMLLDAVVTHQWTAARAQAMTGGLLGWTQQHIADLWHPRPVRQATVSKHLRDASAPVVADAVAIFEQSWKKPES
jgi:hypothetical protein